MFKKLGLFILLFCSASTFAQLDSSDSHLDKLSPEELLLYYINEPEPFSVFKGPTKVGDSLFTDLNTKVIPTQTVNAKGLYHDNEEDYVNNAIADSSFNAQDQQLKPKVSLGAGRLGFYGDLYKKHFQSALTARYAFDLNISQRLTRYLQLNFNVLFGKIGVNERSLNRNANFLTEIRAGGLNLLYDFGNFIPDKYTLRPYISLGISGFEFLSKTDLKDANGNTYYYWQDGSIKNMAEGSPNSQFAVDIKRDYVFETDIRESNVALFGKYAERSWAIPVGAGVVMKVTDRVDLKMNFQVFFTATDYIDGVTDLNGGKKSKDNFSYTSFALQYDLIAKPLVKKKKQSDAYKNVDWLALDKEDYDKDGVLDFDDKCQGTPINVKVTADGCPEDTDADGVANYMDDELETPMGSVVDSKGVALNDDYWQKWHDDYMNDTLDGTIETEYIGNAFALNSKNSSLNTKKLSEYYTIELARYEGAIPSDEMSFLLSIGDINSTTLPNGTTVVYTSGAYKNVKNAIKRKEEYIRMGNANAGVSKVKGKDIVRLTDKELADLLKKQEKISAELNDNLDSTLVKNNNENTENIVENFGQDEIVYRVQLGAFKNKISASVFNTSAGVLELKSGENVYRYVTKGFKTIEEAAGVRADLVIQGYSDAFVTAYKGGKRIPMSETKATVEKGYKEDLNENKIFSSVNKKLVTFKIQLGPNKKPIQVASAEAKYKDLPDLQKQTTTTGNIRFTTGVFTGYDAAEKHRKSLEAKGFNDAFIIATFKDDLISIQEALELLK